MKIFTIFSNSKNKQPNRERLSLILKLYITRNSQSCNWQTQFNWTFLSLCNVITYLRVHTNAKERCKSKQQPHFFEVASLPNQVKVGQKLPTGCCLISLIPFTSEHLPLQGQASPQTVASDFKFTSFNLGFVPAARSMHNPMCRSDFRWHTSILLLIDSSSVLYWSHYGSGLPSPPDAKVGFSHLSIFDG